MRLTLVNLSYRKNRFNNTKFNFLSTALHYATRSGHLAVAMILVGEHGADVDALDCEHWTPLYYAANNGYTLLPLPSQFPEGSGLITILLLTMLLRSHTDLVRYLLSKGADASIRDNLYGRTALDVAKYRQFHDIVKLLLAAPPSATAMLHQQQQNRRINIDMPVRSRGRPKQQQQQPQSSASEVTSGEEIKKNDAEVEDYIRSPEEIEAEGKRHKVLAGIHGGNKNLFLGRYDIAATAVKELENFRQSSKQADITYTATDTVLGVDVVMRHSHDRDRHQAEVAAVLKAQDSGDREAVRMIRSSCLSTNEFVMVTMKATYTKDGASQSITEEHEEKEDSMPKRRQQQVFSTVPEVLTLDILDKEKDKEYFRRTIQKKPYIPSGLSFLLTGVLTAEECKCLIDFCEAKGFELAGLAVGGGELPTHQAVIYLCTIAFSWVTHVIDHLIVYATGQRSTTDRYRVDMNTRNNTRVMFDDKDLAQALWERVEPFLMPEYKNCKPTGLNWRFRVYKYVDGCWLLLLSVM